MVLVVDVLLVYEIRMRPLGVVVSRERVEKKRFKLATVFLHHSSRVLREDAHLAQVALAGLVALKSVLISALLLTLGHHGGVKIAGFIETRLECNIPSRNTIGASEAPWP